MKPADGFAADRATGAAREEGHPHEATSLTYTSPHRKFGEADMKMDSRLNQVAITQIPFTSSVSAGCPVLDAAPLVGDAFGMFEGMPCSMSSGLLRRRLGVEGATSVGAMQDSGFAVRGSVAQLLDGRS